MQCDLCSNWSEEIARMGENFYGWCDERGIIYDSIEITVSEGWGWRD